MKISENYVLQRVIDEYIAVPVGEEAGKLKGVIKLNETGAFLWEKLCQKNNTMEELVDALMSEFSVERERAKIDVETFTAHLEGIGCLKKDQVKM